MNGWGYRPEDLVAQLSDMIARMQEASRREAPLNVPRGRGTMLAMGASPTRRRQESMKLERERDAMMQQLLGRIAGQAADPLEMVRQAMMRLQRAQEKPEEATTKTSSKGKPTLEEEITSEAALRQKLPPAPPAGVWHERTYTPEGAIVEEALPVVLERNENRLKELYKRQHDLNVKANQEGLTSEEEVEFRGLRKNIAESNRVIRQLEQSQESPEQTLIRTELERMERAKAQAEAKQSAEIEKTQAETDRLRAQAVSYTAQAKEREARAKGLKPEEQIRIFTAKQLAKTDNTKEIENLKQQNRLVLAAQKGDMDADKQLRALLTKEHSEFLKAYDAETQTQLGIFQDKLASVDAEKKIIDDPNDPAWDDAVARQREIEKERDSYVTKRIQDKTAISAPRYINARIKDLESVPSEMPGMEISAEPKPAGKAPRFKGALVGKQKSEMIGARVRALDEKLNAIRNDARFLDIQTWAAERFPEESDYGIADPYAVIEALVEGYREMLFDGEPDSLRMVDDLEQRLNALLGAPATPLAPSEKMAREHLKTRPEEFSPAIRREIAAGKEKVPVPQEEKEAVISREKAISKAEEYFLKNDDLRERWYRAIRDFQMGKEEAVNMMKDSLPKYIRKQLGIIG